MSSSIGERISKIFIFILVILLVASFAFFGVSDLFSGRVATKTASIDGEEISEEELQRAIFYAEQYIKRGGRELDKKTKDYIRNNQIERLVRLKLIQAEMHNLGLEVSDNIALESIKNDTTFQNEKGGFDKEIFKSFLRQMSLNEKKYIHTVKKDLAAAIFRKNLMSTPMATEKQISLMHKYQGETRSIRLLKIPATYTVKSEKEPSENDLKEYYEKFKKSFHSPEYRSISYIRFNKKDYENEIEVSDEILKEEYENRKKEFIIQEKRELVQMLLPDEKTANEAYILLEEKEDFFTVAKDKAGQDTKATSFGTSTKNNLGTSGILKKELVESVFSLEKGQFTKPSEGAFGWYIYGVQDIIPSKYRLFDEVKDTLKESLLIEQISDILYETSVNLEDEFAAGLSLKEAAKSLTLKIATIEIDSEGKSKNADKLDNIPEFGDFLSLAFKAEIGENSQIISSPDGMDNFVLNVISKTPPVERTFDEAKKDIIKAWKDSEKLASLRKFAMDISSKIQKMKKSGTKNAFDKVVKKNKLEIIKLTEPIYRSYPKPDEVPFYLVKALFMMKEGDISNAYSDKEGAYIIAELLSVNDAKKDDLTYGIETLSENMEDQHLNDYNHQYINYLLSRYPIKYYDR